MLDAIGGQMVDEETELTFTVTAGDPNDDPANAVALSASGLPSGATFDVATGVFNWTPTESQQGSHVVTFTATDDGTPNLSDSETITITVYEVNDAPLADAGGPYVAAAGVPVSFDASGSFDPDGSIVLYEWDFDNDGTLDFSSPAPQTEFTYPAAYVGEAVLRVTDAEGLAAVDAADVTISLVPQGPVADAGGPYAGTAGVPVNFDASGSFDPDGTITLYEWDWDSDGVLDHSDAAPTTQHTWDFEYAGSVTLRVTDDDGATSVDTADVTIIASAVHLSFGRIGYDRRTQQLTVLVTVTNTSGLVIDGPIHLVVENISEATVTVANANGVTHDGWPYLDLSGLVSDDRLDPGESVVTALCFTNPDSLRFTCDVIVVGSMFQGTGDGDVSGDHFVGQPDLDVVLANWGRNVTPGASEDPSGDGFVGQSDLDVVLANWGVQIESTPSSLGGDSLDVQIDTPDTQGTAEAAASVAVQTEVISSSDIDAGSLEPAIAPVVVDGSAGGDIGRWRGGTCALGIGPHAGNWAAMTPLFLSRARAIALEAQQMWSAVTDSTVDLIADTSDCWADGGTDVGWERASIVVGWRRATSLQSLASRRARRATNIQAGSLDENLLDILDLFPLSVLADV